MGRARGLAGDTCAAEGLPRALGGGQDNQLEATKPSRELVTPADVLGLVSDVRTCCRTWWSEHASHLPTRVEGCDPAFKASGKRSIRVLAVEV